MYLENLHGHAQFSFWILIALAMTGHLIGCRKNKKLCGNFLAYYAEEYVDYAENKLDYAEI